MGISGSTKALMPSFSGALRSGAGRSGYFPALVYVTIGGEDWTRVTIKPSLSVVENLDQQPNTASLTLRAPLAYANITKGDLPLAYWQFNDREGYAQAVLGDGAVGTAAGGGAGGMLWRLNGSVDSLGRALDTGENYSGLVLANLPAAYWRLDTASPFADSSGNGNTGIGGGGIGGGGSLGVTGDFNLATLFDGNDYISVGHPLGASIGSELTFEAWVNHNTVAWAAAEEFLIALDWVVHATWFTVNGGFPRIAISHQGGTNVLQATTAVPTSGWHHLVATVSENRLRLYMDGTVIAMAATTLIPPITTVSGCVIGALAGASNFYKGYLDEVAVYPRALTPVQVFQHYQAWQWRGPSPATPAGTPAPAYGFAGPLSDGSTAVRLTAAGTGAGDTGSYFTTSAVGIAPVLPAASTLWTWETWFKCVEPASVNSRVLMSMSPIALLVGLGPLILLEGGTARIAGGTNVIDGRWHHCAVVCTGSTATLYLDGAVEGTYTGVLSITVGDLHIGRLYGGGFTFGGYLSHVAVYPRPLAAAQIANHYAQQTSLARMATRTTVTDIVANTSLGLKTGHVLLQQPGALANGTTAVAFDGAATAGGALVFPDPALRRTTLSLEVWVQFTATSGSATLVSSANDGLGGFALTRTSGAGTLHWTARTLGAVTVFDLVTPASYADGAWHHVVATADATTARLYVDGVQVASSAVAAGGIVASAWWLMAGAQLGSGGVPLGVTGNSFTSFFTGRLDGFAIYPTVLAAGRVAAHYAARTLTGRLFPGSGPEIVIGLGSPTNRWFAGYILPARIKVRVREQVVNRMDLDCVDYTYFLDRYRIGGRLWTNANITTILTDILTYLPVSHGFTLRVEAGLPTIDSFQANHTETISSIITRLSNRSGSRWRVDYDKVIHFHRGPEADTQPRDLTDTNLDFWNVEYVEDTSQTRTRVYATGASSSTTASVPVGAVVIPVDDTRMFASGGGEALAGANWITYSGKSVAQGPGTLTGVPGSGRGSVLYGIAQGDSVRVFTERNDLMAQQELANKIGFNTLGVPDDGIVAQSIDSGSDGDAAARANADGELLIWSGDLDRLSYMTRDPFAQAGKTVTSFLTQPSCVLGSYVIQTVTITDFGRTNRFPARAVQAGGVRIDIVDVLRALTRS